MAQQYGRWRVKEALGEGGQAHTFLVYDVDDEGKRLFVLKRLKNKKRLERFKKEVKSSLGLSHPNVLKVIDSDLDNSDPYFVAEFCAGGALGDADLSRFTLIERLRIFSLICCGVGYAHSNGVIHRDLKPDNIFLRDDQTTPVIGDFGLCFITDDGERFTLVDEAVGPRLYMAPELADGLADKVTSASDVYSLGKVLYWMLAGRVFDREKHRDQRFDLTRDQIAPDYFFIYDLLDKMIVEDINHRLADANALVGAVDEVIRLIEMRAHPVDLAIPQQCNYCGRGLYRKVADTTSLNDGRGSTDVSNFGFELVGMPQWLILACDHCGHVQMFRPDHAKDRDVWNKK